MENKDLIQTITAIKIALQSGVGDDKAKMKFAIKVALGFADNALNQEEVIVGLHEEPYDDLNPDYIKSSQEEI